MMPKVLFMNVCQSAAVEPGTENLSLLGIVENVFLPREAFRKIESGDAKVAAGGPITVVAMLSWTWPSVVEKTPFRAVLKIESPQGQKTDLVFIDVDVSDSYKRARLIMRVQAFPIDVPGTYVFSIEVENESLASYPIDVEVSEPSSVKSPPESASSKKKAAKKPAKKSVGKKIRN